MFSFVFVFVVFQGDRRFFQIKRTSKYKATNKTQQMTTTKNTNNYQQTQQRTTTKPNQTKRHHLDFKKPSEVPLSEVEDAVSICSRFVTGGMSLGALSSRFGCVFFLFFLWFFHGFLWFSMAFLCFSMFFYGFSMAFLWFFYGFSDGVSMVFSGFSMFL